MSTVNWWQSPWTFTGDAKDALVALYTVSDTVDALGGVALPELHKDWLQGVGLSDDRVARSSSSEPSLRETKGRLPMARYSFVDWETIHTESHGLAVDCTLRVVIYTSKGTNLATSQKLARQIALTLSTQIIVSSWPRYHTPGGGSVFETWRCLANGAITVAGSAAQVTGGHLGRSEVTIKLRHYADVPAGV